MIWARGGAQSLLPRVGESGVLSRPRESVCVRERGRERESLPERER